VKTSRVIPEQLDLAYLALFFGLRVNELVMQRMAGAGFRGVRESHGYLMQHLIEADRSITELARRMHVTQQAASKAVAELIGLRILEAAPAKDRRSKSIRLSERGCKACDWGGGPGLRLTSSWSPQLAKRTMSEPRRSC
jgi:hypothetical protein